MNTAANSLTVSSIMPVHNAERYLEEALASAFAQTEPATELIVIDDGSTDATAEILKRYSDRLHCVRQMQQGPVVARNKGIELSTGALLNFIDADDICPPTRNASLTAPFRADPTVDITMGLIRQFISPDLSPEAAARFHCPTEPQLGQAVAGVMVRRSAFAALGMFRADLKVAEFMDWYLRAQEAKLRIEPVAEVILERRIHGGNFSMLNAELQKVEYPRVLQASLARRRAQKS